MTELLTSENRARLRELQQKQDAGITLSPAEQIELTSLYQQIEAGEAAYLVLANERLHLEAERLEGQNAVLAKMIQRRHSLLTQMQAILAEDNAIVQELKRLLPESIVETEGGIVARQSA